MIQSIEEYLKLLRSELSNSDPAIVQDALADAEEHLRNALAGAREKNPDAPEADLLAPVIEQYGTPSETAAAYAEIERRTASGLTSESGQPRPLLARIFGVYAEARTWGALLYMLTALLTGIVYFTWAVTGLSLSVSFSILIFGLPFALLFLLSIRGLALLEGRLVEALLGRRMPRRPLFGYQGMKWLDRLKMLITDKNVWLAIVYMLLQMPLGVLYFSLVVILLSLSLSFMAAPVVQLIWNFPIMSFGNQAIFLPPGALLLFFMGGFLLLTLSMHLARGVGELHGRYARWMLVTE